MAQQEVEKRLKALEDVVKINEKRLKVMEDIEEIKKLHYRYIYALNARKWEEIIDMFSEDMKEDGFPAGQIHTGKEEIAKIFRNMGENSRGTPLHATIIAQPVISVEGDKAKGYWLWLGRINDRRIFTSDSGQEGDYVIQIRPKLGRYDMEYKRVDEEWKISYLKFTLPWPNVQQAPNNPIS